MAITPWAIIRTADAAKARAVAHPHTHLIDVPADALTILSAPADRAMCLDVARGIAAALAQVHAVVDVIPLRLGAVIASPEAAADWLKTRTGHFQRLLDMVSDRTEWAATVTLPVQPTQPPALPTASAPTGGSYLARRKSIYAQRDGIPAHLEPALSAWARSIAGDAAIIKIQGDPHIPGRVAVFALVHKHAHSVPERFGRTPPPSGCTAELSGPWPPANFVNDTALPA